MPGDAGPPLRPLIDKGRVAGARRRRHRCTSASRRSSTTTTRRSTGPGGAGKCSSRPTATRPSSAVARAVFEQLLDDAAAAVAATRRRWSRSPATTVRHPTASRARAAGARPRPAQPAGPRRSDVRRRDVLEAERHRIYGRRQDMFLKYLERSGRVRSIVHFDNPMTPERLFKTYRAAQARRRPEPARRAPDGEPPAAPARHRPGALPHVPARRATDPRRLGLPRRERYADYVKSVLERARHRRPADVFWVYPTNVDLPWLIDALDPDIVVADVVDDNRTWHDRGLARCYDRVERNYEDVLARSDVVLANCEPVAETMRRFAPRGPRRPERLRASDERRGARPVRRSCRARGPDHRLRRQPLVPARHPPARDARPRPSRSGSSCSSVRRTSTSRSCGSRPSRTSTSSGSSPTRRRSASSAHFDVGADPACRQRDDPVDEPAQGLRVLRGGRAGRVDADRQPRRARRPHHRRRGPDEFVARSRTRSRGRRPPDAERSRPTRGRSSRPGVG